MLQSVTECYRVFLAHLLGPIFGLVFARTIALASMVFGCSTMDHWPNDAMVLMGHSHLTLTKIEILSLLIPQRKLTLAI